MGRRHDRHDQCRTRSRCTGRSDQASHLCAIAESSPLRGRAGARDARHPVSRFPASPGAEGSGVGRRQSGGHAAPLSDRYAWPRSLAPVAGWVLGRNIGGIQGSRRASGEQSKDVIMSEQGMSSGFDPNSVRKIVNVDAPQSVAWDVFTQQMGSWWPLAVYKIGSANAVDAVMEPRVGGRWYERGDDGSTCDWGRVLAWEPPSRLVLSYDITADWQYDPKLNTEIEVRFISEGSSRTRVEF